jgi:hypothetical protein
VLWKKYGNLDLNQGPAGYEGGRLSYYPLSSNHFEQDDRGIMPKMLLDFIEYGWQNISFTAPQVHRRTFNENYFFKTNTTIPYEKDTDIPFLFNHVHILLECRSLIKESYPI